MAPEQETKTAKIYRMVMPDHLCPYGLKSKDLLEGQGYNVEDHHLETHRQTEEFKKQHGVSTTPQTFIGGRRIGGYDDLRKYFGLDARDASETSYQPVIAIFLMALLMALAVSWAARGDFSIIRIVEWFIAISMCLLAVQKLQDVEGFSIMFLNYDLLARRWVRYAYLYPFGEALAGVLMISGALIWIASTIALVIGTIGATSVFKAVYLDGRELKCACVGGKSNVPLGFVSLTENLMMVAMAVWMPARMLWYGQ